MERYKKHHDKSVDPEFFSEPNHKSVSKSKSGFEQKVTKSKNEKSAESSGELIPIKEILSQHEYFDNELFT